MVHSQAPTGADATDLERATFALFMQPDWDEKLSFPEKSTYSSRGMFFVLYKCLIYGKGTVQIEEKGTIRTCLTKIPKNLLFFSDGYLLKYFSKISGVLNLEQLLDPIFGIPYLWRVH
ncbi:uncharacterized protein LOC141677079 isoform X1 [Apium graveolens]|uniref:uncharacterized protein LOC141677079 isoform X1 n=1 Tax=Apium graveolens TaxID=4045 RepID=UPI003D7A4243